MTIDNLFDRIAYLGVGSPFDAPVEPQDAENYADWRAFLPLEFINDWHKMTIAERRVAYIFANLLHSIEYDYEQN